MQIIMIEWEDSCTEPTWHRRDSGLDTTASCVSVGVMVHEDTSKITIFQSISITTGNIGDTITIPRGCIKRIRKLKVS